jgi:type VI protein secretion system component VasK
MNEGSGCLGTLLLGAGVVVLVGYGGEKAVVFLAPYWPLIRFAIVIAAIIWIWWFVRALFRKLFRRWLERQRAEQQIQVAKAELRDIRRETMRQMNRVKRRQSDL